MPRRLIFTLFLLCGASFAQAQLHYRAQQLPNLPGIPYTVGLGLNDSGEVVGYCTHASQAAYILPNIPDGTLQPAYTEVPFLWRNGSLIRIAPNGFYDYKSGFATSINNNGLATRSDQA